MKVLVLAPMHSEYESFKRNFDTDKLKHQYSVYVTGIGKVNAASFVATQINSRDYDLVVVIGYCAGSKQFAPGEWVIPNRTAYWDTSAINGITDELAKEFELQGPDDVIALTGDKFVDEKLCTEILERFGSKVIFDMEIAAVAQVCDDANIPVVAFKMVSDVPELCNSEADFKAFVEENNDFSPITAYVEAL